MSRDLEINGLLTAPMRVGLALGLLATGLFAALPAAQATENGTTHYPVGVNTVGDGYMPLPGTLSWRNYTLVQWSGTLADDSGDEELPGYGLNAEVNAARFLYTFKQPIGPFHYSIGAVLTLVHNHLDIGPMSDQATGLDDMDFQNYLSWHSPDERLFIYSGLDIYAPTGRYDADDLANVGKNYWSFDPSINLTYHATDKLTLESAVYAEFNTKNSATRYQSGNSVDWDYAANYQPFVNRSPDDFAQHLAFGIQGYLLRQFSDDEQFGETVGPDGHRAEAFAIGPQVIYNTRFGGAALKWQHDFGVRNRAEGDTVWVQFAVPLLGTATHVGPHS
ncbi:transporter [Salinisphaera sp. Q1T1-3]|uniref:SphA family protein n=1 Tax=Salinisphaera sp. Q1T1-3 TaxID=2321229 RepID=UPI0013147D15|nr:transporter [Salinisphaera sp. Q1T1-3]